jgi:hypothetical protein
MTREIVHRLGDLMNRRAFLRRVAAAAAGAVGLLQGWSGFGVADTLYPCACCWLCRPCNYFPCSGCACTWTWHCPDQSGTIWRCHECHGTNTYCGSGCLNVICSRAERTGLSPGSVVAW